MLLLRPIACAAAVLLPFAAFTQELRTIDPAQADAAVPLVVYQSVFADYQSLEEQAESPAQTWSAANQEAGLIGGHAGQIKNPDAAVPSQIDAGSQPSTQHSGKHHH